MRASAFGGLDPIVQLTRGCSEVQRLEALAEVSIERFVFREPLSIPAWRQKPFTAAMRGSTAALSTGPPISGGRSIVLVIANRLQHLAFRTGGFLLSGSVASSRSLSRRR